LAKKVTDIKSIQVLKSKSLNNHADYGHSAAKKVMTDLTLEEIKQQHFPD